MRGDWISGLKIHAMVQEEISISVNLCYTMTQREILIHISHENLKFKQDSAKHEPQKTYVALRLLAHTAWEELVTMRRNADRDFKNSHPVVRNKRTILVNFDVLSRIRSRR